MKILAIGDFHGKFPEKLKKEARKADIILCNGDIAGMPEIRKLLFSYWKKGKIWHEEIGLKKAKKLIQKDYRQGIKILRELNRLNKKVILVFGNSDYYKSWMFKDDKLSPGHYENIIKKLKNIKLIHKKTARADGLTIIGHGGYLDITEYLKPKTLENIRKRKHDKLVERYLKEEKEVLDLFRKNKSKLKNFIFLAHYTPYKVLDFIKNKNSPLKGTHAGFEPYNAVIKKYEPIICICGHMHESQGTKKLGKTIVINPGPAYEGKAALIELEGQKIKSIKFIK